MSSPPDPFEFLKSLWGPMGLPLAGLGAPTSAMSEIDRRIAELKSVETWLNMNLSVLRMSIQALEMQKAGLAAMQSAASAGGTPPPQGGDDPEKK
ncbi:MAG TPA: PhaM family polyhydroxyalkanoate granule multifunctional regulatory protein [Burkholderiales bacterium]|nr:PhaM family polyhydroxyalkanoate granule multifunctional regulatory protein [Burkholderiales bacterium]